jgi:tetratricopeptide (TPR) repeat protein
MRALTRWSAAITGSLAVFAAFWAACRYPAGLDNGTSLAIAGVPLAAALAVLGWWAARETAEPDQGPGHASIARTSGRSQVVTGNTGVIIGGDVRGATIHIGSSRDESQPSRPTPRRAGLDAADVSLRLDALGLQISRLIVPSLVSAPHTLPRDIAAFTGRRVELEHLMQTVTRTAVTGGVVGIHAIDGMAGVGKTAFALHAAHQLAPLFPDGQIFLPLYAHTPGQRQADSAEALGVLLLSIGLAAQQIPHGLHARTAAWHHHLSEKKLLLLLDDAAGHEQIRPLLPGDGDSLVIVTSRRRMAALEDVLPISLDRLPPEDAAALFRRLAARPGPDAEPTAVREVVRLCGYLPLAIRLIAGRLRHHPAWSVADLASDMAAAKNRLATMHAENVSVAAAFDMSYQNLPTGQQRLFQLLGLQPGPDIDVCAATALSGTDLTTTRANLDALYTDHLIEEPSHSRYRLHDLLHLYARERADNKGMANDHTAAIHRVLSWYLRTADAASYVLRPERRKISLDASEGSYPPLTFATYNQALRWHEAELPNLIAGVRWAMEHGYYSIAWQLPAVLWSFFDIRKNWDAWITTYEIALTASRYLENQFGEAFALNGLGAAEHDLRRIEEALSHFQQALIIRRAIGDHYGEGSTLNKLGKISKDLRQFDEAVNYFQQALAIQREIGNQRNEGWALDNLGDTYRELSRFEEALSCSQRALAIRRKIGNRRDEGWTLDKLGQTYHKLQRFEQAIEHLQQSLTIRQSIEDRHGEAITLSNLAEVLNDMGKRDAARESWRQALAIFENLGDPRATDVRTRLEALDSRNPGERS